MAITGIPLDDEKTGTSNRPLGGSVQSPTPDVPTVPGGAAVATKDFLLNTGKKVPITGPAPGTKPIGIASPPSVKGSMTFDKGATPIGIAEPQTVKGSTTFQQPSQTKPIGIAEPTTVKGSTTSLQPTQTKPSEPVQPTQPVQPPPDETEISLDGVNEQLKEIGDLAKRMMNGEMVDNVFDKQLNKYISNISLFNAADMAALNQQVASDPNLQGTGLGYALLGQAARDSGMRVSDMLGKLSIESANNLMSLQKFGIGMALDVTGQQEGIRQWQETQKEGTRRWEDTQKEDTRRWNENMEYKREGRDYDRMGDAINLAMTSGDFGSAAKGINDFASKHFPGMGISVTASSLAARDPHFAQDFVDDMNNIKDLARRDPEQALERLENMMADPMYDGMFTEGITADQIIESIVSGQYDERQEFEAGAVLDLNEFAADDWDTLSLDTNATIDYDRIMGTQDERETRQIVDWTDQAGDLTIQDVKDVYKSEGLTEPTNEEAEAILADTEASRTMAKKKDYLNRVNEAQQSVNIQNELTKALQSAGILEQYVKDPQQMADLETYWALISTGDEDAEAPWLVDDGNSYSYVNWKTWPHATFDTQTGKLINTGYKGGHLLTDNSVAAMKAQDPNWETKNADLDQAYRTYREGSDENTLSAPEWYYATAGGTLPPNAENIPGNIGDPPPPPPPTYETMDTQQLISYALDNDINVDIPPSATPDEARALIDAEKNKKPGIMDEGFKFEDLEIPEERSGDTYSNALSAIEHNSQLVSPQNQTTNMIDFVGMLSEKVEKIMSGSGYKEKGPGGAGNMYRRGNAVAEALGVDNPYPTAVAASSGERWNFSNESIPVDLMGAMILNGGLSQKDAYILAANMVGKDKMDESFKKVFGKSYDELVSGGPQGPTILNDPGTPEGGMLIDSNILPNNSQNIGQG